MVVVEKNYKHIDEGPIRNVRRTRSPNPNADDGSGSDDEDGGMRVGAEYQAVIPDYIPNGKPESKVDAMLVWAPHPDAAVDSTIDDYTAEAKEKHGYNTEQALGMLFWHKHSVEKALADLPNFTPFPDEWSVEDRVLFEQAFGFHGKSFCRIRQMLPDKSVPSLVKYYYSWKKTRSRTSLIDRQAHKIAISREVSDEDADGSSTSESEVENAKDSKDDAKGGAIGRGGLISRSKRDSHARQRSKRKPPRGMYLNDENILAVASEQSDIILKPYTVELVALKRQVQNNKQLLGSLKERMTVGIDSFRAPEAVPKIIGKWSNEELLLAVQGIRKYGKNFKAIAEVIGNKTESLLRSFFVNYRRRYNLDEVLAEYDKEHGQHDSKESADREETPMEEDGNTENGSSQQPPPASNVASFGDASDLSAAAVPTVPLIPTVAL